MGAREHPRAKLKKSDVVSILKLASNGKRSGLIAKQFGVGKNTILDILSGKTWKSIDRPFLPVRRTGAYDRPLRYGNTCSVDGCENPVDARGWCTNHWARWKSHGDPLGGRTPPGEPEKYLAEVVLAYDGDECLFWPYSRYSNGRAAISREGSIKNLCRIVCEGRNGPPPTPEHHAAHSCGYGHLGCVTQRHLRWATPKENADDKNRHGTVTRGSGHPHAKITEKDAAFIRSMAGRVTQSNLSRRFGISQSTVRDIQSGRIWRALNTGGE